MHASHSLRLACLTLALSLNAFAQTPPVPAAPPAPKLPPLFPFILPWDDASPSPTNLSTWLEPVTAQKFVTAKEGHLYLGDKRLRLFGVNISNDACFPSHEDADKSAARLAKFGIGCVRFSRLDTKPAPLGLFQADLTTIDPSQLDKFDYFISALKQRGIRTDLILHDGRPYPGFPTWEGMPEGFRGVDNFYPPMIDAQRKVAAALLGHVNPYTKSPYANEPAVAFIELNNHSSLVKEWWSYELDDLPEIYGKEIQAQWNKWLTAKYGTDEKLRAEWNAHVTPVGDVNLLVVPKDFSNWVGEVKYPSIGKGQPAVGEPIPATWLHVAQTGTDPGQAYYVRYHQIVNAKKSYTFTFQARSDRDRQLFVRAQQVSGFFSTAVNITVNITAGWKKYSVTFVPTMSLDEARFGFYDLGAEPSDWYFGDLLLTTSAAQGLSETEKLGTVSVVAKRDYYGRTAEVQRDWMAFLLDTEKAYWSGMASYLKDTLHTRSLLMGAQAGESPSLTQASLDAVQAEALWQAPRFPFPSAPDRWYSKSLSMVTDAKGGAISSLAMKRVAGKPFICTGYDEPAPNTFSSECFPLLAAYAALQDWDAIFASSYSSDLANLKSGLIGNFEDIAQNPNQMASLPAAVAMFVRADVKAAAPRTVAVPFAAYLDQLTKTGPATDLTNFGVNPDEALRRPVILATDGTSSPTPPNIQSVYPGITSDTMELRWNTNATRSTVTIDTDKSAGFIGFSQDLAFPLSQVTITPHATLQGWCAIHATVLEGESFQNARRLLITATGSGANTDMKWKSGPLANLAKDWGTAPSLVEGIGATISFPGKTGTKAWALDSTGHRGAEVRVKIEQSRATLEISPEAKTLWYEVELAP